MKTRPVERVFGFLLILALSGCAPTRRSHEHSAHGGKDEAVQQALQSDTTLEKRLTELFAKPHYQAYPCQTADLEKKLELARALDSRKAELTAYFAERASQPDAVYDRKKVGPLEVRVHRELPTPTPGWTETQLDWAPILRDYAETAALTDAPIKYWAWLYGDLAWYLTSVDDSTAAATSPRWLEMNRRVTENMASIYERMKKCVEDPACATPEFSEEEALGISRTDRLRAEIAKVFATPDLRSARLETFYYDYDYAILDTHRFRKNRKIVSDGIELTVPMIAGFFKGFEQEFSEAATSEWNVLGRKIKIDWRGEEEAGVYRIKFFDDPTGRAFVDHSELSLNLQRGVRLKSIPHELGHVLGFKDYYYENYQPSTCMLTEEVEGTDLMSDSSKGVISQKHWDLLDRYYPAN